MKNYQRIIGFTVVLSALLLTGCSKDENKHFADKNWSNADLKNGGQLYDKWWEVNGGTEPTSTWSLYPSTSAKSGNTTWRCKECHGWDYIGKDGRYSSGSHYTGIAGVWDARNNDKTDIFDSIKDEGGNHDLSAVLSDDDVLDLTKFIVDGLVDVSKYVNSSGFATGDTTAGNTLYTANCASCHGADGKIYDFESDEGEQGVGFLANDNPQETFHKIRWGHPGTAMPSMIADKGLTDDECGDILAYAQHSLPE
ncbi:MAG: c-type cytochrome [Fidelibacterota bacterium]